MAATVEEMKANLAALSASERAELACFLLDSLGQEAVGKEPSWRAELIRRADAIKNGQAPAVPAEQECAELRKRLTAVEKERDIYLEAIHGMTRHLVRADFTREELDEMERSGITAEQIIADVEKIIRG